MALVVVTLRIMPESVDTDLDAIEDKANAIIKRFGGDPGKKVITPIAFGLKALDIFFILPEEKGSTEEMEKAVSEIEGINSVEVTDVRRAIG